MEKKQTVSIPALCTGCPNQFAEYLAYCRSLKFEAKPNISYLRGMFRDLFRSQVRRAEMARFRCGDGRRRIPSLVIFSMPAPTRPLFLTPSILSSLLLSPALVAGVHKQHAMGLVPHR